MCQRKLRIWSEEKKASISVVRPTEQEGEFPRVSFDLLYPKLVAEEASSPETSWCRTKSTLEVCCL